MMILSWIGKVSNFWRIKKKNWYFSQKKASQVEVKLKSELLDQKSLTSPTCFNFEIFDHDPQLDIKFLNP